MRNLTHHVFFRLPPSLSGGCRRGASRPPARAQTADHDALRPGRQQPNAGLQSATDGVFRRASWHMDFIYQIGGISKAPGNLAVRFHNPGGDIEFTPAALHVGSRIHLAKTIFEADFAYLKSLAGTSTAK